MGHEELDYTECPRCGEGHYHPEGELPEHCKDCEWCFGDKMCPFCAVEPTCRNQGDDNEHCGRRRCKAEFDKLGEQS